MWDATYDPSTVPQNGSWLLWLAIGGVLVLCTAVFFLILIAKKKKKDEKNT